MLVFITLAPYLSHQPVALPGDPRHQKSDDQKACQSDTVADSSALRVIGLSGENVLQDRADYGGAKRDRKRD